MLNFSLMINKTYASAPMWKIVSIDRMSVVPRFLFYVNDLSLHENLHFCFIIPNIAEKINNTIFVQLNNFG